MNVDRGCADDVLRIVQEHVTGREEGNGRRDVRAKHRLPTTLTGSAAEKGGCADLHLWLSLVPEREGAGERHLDGCLR